MKINHFLSVILLTLLCFLLGACKNNTTYYSYQHLEDNEWDRKDTLLFLLPDTLKAGTYQLEVGVRHTADYAYRDLWIELIQYIPDQNAPLAEWVEKKDTFHLYLAGKNGKWEGTGSTSSFYQLILPCGLLTLPENPQHKEANTVDSGDEEQKEPTHSKDTKKARKKYTFLGTPKTVGAESKHKLRMVHIMKDSVLHHIANMGLRLSSVQHDLSTSGSINAEEDK